MMPPKTLPQTTSQPRWSRMTRLIMRRTLLGVRVVMRCERARSISSLTLATSTYSRRSKLSVRELRSSMPTARSMGLTVTVMVAKPPNMGASVARICPSGVAASRSSLSARAASKPSACMTRSRRDLRSMVATRSAERCETYVLRNRSSKNVSRIMVLSAARISLKRRGITPEPTSSGMRSKSIVTASALVTPPAKPKSPKASTAAAAAFSRPRKARITRPEHNTKKVTMFEASPLFGFSNGASQPS
mmetsp:Transcript_14362/g.45287  ORF Transcript_14362/g.45287 Transcript_14362/m.45287 type:complete len:247 (-) Transcript_14362:228-968(-)